MVWAASPSAVNVTFKRDGIEIESPVGYTLNDFSISSQLNDSSSVEEWPRVIVDDGWEAYSSLNLKVSLNFHCSIFKDLSVVPHNAQLLYHFAPTLSIPFLKFF